MIRWEGSWGDDAGPRNPQSYERRRGRCCEGLRVCGERCRRAIGTVLRRLEGAVRLRLTVHCTVMFAGGSTTKRSCGRGHGGHCRQGIARQQQQQYRNYGFAPHVNRTPEASDLFRVVYTVTGRCEVSSQEQPKKEDRENGAGPRLLTAANVGHQGLAWGTRSLIKKRKWRAGCPPSLPAGCRRYLPGGARRYKSYSSTSG